MSCKKGTTLRAAAGRDEADLRGRARIAARTDKPSHIAAVQTAIEHRDQSRATLRQHIEHCEDCA